MRETIIGKNVFDVYFKFLVWSRFVLNKTEGIYDRYCSLPPGGGQAVWASLMESSLILLNSVNGVKLQKWNEKITSLPTKLYMSGKVLSANIKWHIYKTSAVFMNNSTDLRQDIGL